jgi:hypothetical protein
MRGVLLVLSVLFVVMAEPPYMEISHEDHRALSRVMSLLHSTQPKRREVRVERCFDGHSKFHVLGCASIIGGCLIAGKSLAAVS